MTGSNNRPSDELPGAVGHGFDRHSLDSHPLDNMAWAALRGPQADLAEVAPNQGAARYLRRVSPIAAVETTDDAGWAGLAALTRPGGYIGLFRRTIDDPPGGWTEVYRGPVVQYVAGDLDDAPEIGMTELTAHDAEDMLALAKLTEPGPFSIETYRTGRYFGLRESGLLIAMAGERMRIDGWGEVSAVCVHPDARRRGLGEAATLRAAAAITARGDRPMLHVAHDNDPAHRLYQRLGFEARVDLDVAIFKRDG